MMSERNARAARRSQLKNGDNPMYPPANELVYPKAPRARRGTVRDKKSKIAAFLRAMATQKRTGGKSLRSFLPLSASTEAYYTRKRDAARKRYAGRTDVIAKQMARAAAREAKFAEASAKRAQREKKRKRAAARGPIELTMSPLTIEAILGRRRKAGAAALKRRMRDDNFAARHRQKMLGRKYRQVGRLLGEKYKAPVEKRKTTRTRRVQDGIGLKKGANSLFFMDRRVMRLGDHGSRASLMDYADRMRQRAREAYVERKRRMGLSSAVRTPMNAEQRKAKRRDAYKRKKKAMERTVTSPSNVSNRNVGSMSTSPQFSPGPPSPPPRRISPPKTRAATSAMAQQRAVSKKAANTLRRSNRLRRQSM